MPKPRSLAVAKLRVTTAAPGLGIQQSKTRPSAPNTSGDASASRSGADDSPGRSGAQHHTMTQETVTAEVSFAWWFRLYLHGVCLMAALTGMQPDWSKVERKIAQAARIRFRSS